MSALPPLALPDPPVPAPAPVPPLPPSPAPVPSPLKAEIDALFLYLEAQFATRPFVLALIRTLQRYVDANVQMRLHHNALVPTANKALPPYIKQLFDMAVGAVSVFWPQYAPVFQYLQQLVDQYLAAKAAGTTP